MPTRAVMSGPKNDKPHMSVVVFGHMDCGKSTIVAGLAFARDEVENPALIAPLERGAALYGCGTARAAYLSRFIGGYEPWIEREPKKQW